MSEDTGPRFDRLFDLTLTQSPLRSMATTAVAAPEAEHHDDHGHDHPAFLAHHFDTPEQQFDSGKLGIWIFLVTEVLFFSGMFCAYAIFRSMRPDVFEGCSQFLNTRLGAINTGVLLFSSLTMAWAVRCSQTEEHTKLTALLAATLSCGMIFLGVKAIEYTHKWHMGLLPGAWFSYDPNHPHIEGAPNYLAWVCAPFVLLTVGTLMWLIVAYLRGRTFQVACAKPLVVVCLSFFAGVGLGAILESGESASHASEDHEGDAFGEIVAHEGTTGLVASSAVDPTEEDTEAQDVSPLERLAADATNSGLRSELEAWRTQTEVAGSSVVSSGAALARPIESVPANVMTPKRAGAFFGIYFAMTGIHAIHILGGLGVLVWLLVRSVRRDFNRQYFGPVDYVGLYWHLVDLIWIYLFPLLYLIR